MGGGLRTQGPDSGGGPVTGSGHWGLSALPGGLMTGEDAMGRAARKTECLSWAQVTAGGDLRTQTLGGSGAGSACCGVGVPAGGVGCWVDWKRSRWLGSHCQAHCQCFTLGQTVTLKVPRSAAPRPRLGGGPVVSGFRVDDVVKKMAGRSQPRGCTTEWKPGHPGPDLL